MVHEGLNLEYKREYSENIKKTVIAFANTDGGKIVIGVDDDGNSIGLTNIDDTILKISNSIRDTISPDITMFTKIKAETKDDKKIIIVHINKGTSYPYYLKSKGIRPEGVFVRQGASSVPASDSQIIKMIKDNTGTSFETSRSLEQDLSFITLREEFNKLDLKLNESKMKSLSIKGSDNLYTNLALLLSDNCTQTIKLAVFEGTNKLIFKDRYEFTGSILKQLKESFETINRYNRTRSHIEGLKRVDQNEYPIPAIREALLNSIIHRDYSFNASTLISIFEDRLEILSVGGLAKGIDREDIMLGVSISRNKRLANIFYRLEYVEAYGTGIDKIMDSYQKQSSSLKPIIEISNNAFKITLPSLYYSNSNNQKSYLSKNEEKAMDIIKDTKKITRSELEKKLSISTTMTIKILNKLIDINLIQKHNTGKNTFYTPI